MYVFLDPLCPTCWDMQPTLRKLQVEYGQYFTVRTVLSTKLNKLNTVCNFPNADLSNDPFSISKIEHSVFPSIAVKANEFQGKKSLYGFS